MVKVPMSILFRLRSKTKLSAASQGFNKAMKKLFKLDYGLARVRLKLLEPWPE